MLDKYLAEGFKAVRVVGIFASDFDRKLQSLILEYEKATAVLFEEYPISAVCLYPEQVKNTKFGREIRDKACHPFRAKKLNV